MAAVTVVGSYALGLTLRAARFPVAGETLVGRDFDEGPGGKGSNQAIQAARLGADVELVALLGQDRFGDQALATYAAEGVGTRYLARTADRNTGVGFIILDAAGQNLIVLDPGANALLSAEHVEIAGERLGTSSVVIAQLEIPVETALFALRVAKQGPARTILNPAPARPIPPAQLAGIDIVTPNESEIRVLLGRPPDDPADSRDLCRALIEAGVSTVVLTRGARGALIVTGEGELEIPSHPVDVVDTTGAGDAFNGALATAIAEGADLEAAVRWAVVAGALACTRLGVVPSLPRRGDIDRARRDLTRPAPRGVPS